MGVELGELPWWLSPGRLLGPELGTIGFTGWRLVTRREDGGNSVSFRSCDVEGWRRGLQAVNRSEQLQ